VGNSGNITLRADPRALRILRQDSGGRDSVEPGKMPSVAGAYVAIIVMVQAAALGASGQSVRSPLEHGGNGGAAGGVVRAGSPRLGWRGLHWDGRNLAPQQVEDFHGAVFGAHRVDFVQDDHGLARVGVAETGEELVEAGAAWWDVQEIGQGLEAGVVVSDVAVEDGNGVVGVEFLGEVSHHEGFAAAAASEDGEVFGDSGVGVAEDGVDDGFGFVAHEGLVGDVVEVEDAVVFDGAGVVAQGFFSGA